MPPVVAAAAVTAAGGLGGAALASRQANRATDAQLRANREAMSYEREKEWQSRADARQQYDQYMRATYGDRYQPNATAPAAVPGAAPAVAPALAGAAPVLATPATPVVGAVPPPAETGLPALAGDPIVAPTARPRNMAQIGPWSASNFGNYLGGR